MLKIGLFQKFKGADTVLIEGAPSDIEALSKTLSELGAEVLAVHEIADVAPRHPVMLFAASVLPRNRGLWWNCSQEEVETIRGKLEPLVQGERGHQYFNLEGTHMQLIVSVGEYGAEWWREHG